MFHHKMISAAMRLFYADHRGQEKQKFDEVETRARR